MGLTTKRRRNKPWTRCASPLSISSQSRPGVPTTMAGLPDNCLNRKVDVRLPGARPVHLIITMIKWIRTSRLSIKNSLYIPD